MLPLFQMLITFIILFNTVTLAMDSYPVINKDMDIAFTYFNYVFTAIFVFEALIKIIGLGLRSFIRDRFNIFDLIVVIISIVELTFSKGGSGGFSGLRAVRLFRIVRLARSFERLKLLIDSIAHTLTAIGNFIILLVLFIYVYALLGMTFFAGTMKFEYEGGPLNKETGTSP
jgi:glucose-6-phosphate-specific signal transduction histidine kinase